jgi:hypothetical protein
MESNKGYEGANSDSGSRRKTTRETASREATAVALDLIRGRFPFMALPG